MQLTYLLACVLTIPAAWVCSETIGHVTRDYFGDIFTLLEDCDTGSCEHEGRRAAQIPGEKCRCQCAPSNYVFREDLKQCIKDVGECPVAMFVRPFAVERIPLVFLPMTGQLVYPGAHLTVSGIARQASSKHLSCNVKASLLMTTHGWQPIRTPSQIFGVYYDGNKTFLQWLGDDEDRRRLQHHLVLIRLLCEGESSSEAFEPCAALRIGYAPGLEPEFADQSTNKNNFIIIGLCLGILGLIYVGAVLIYLKVRKNRREAGRQGLNPSQSSIEAADEDTNNCSTRRNAYINNLVQEAEFTSKSSLKNTTSHSPNDHDIGPADGNSSSHDSKHTKGTDKLWHTDYNRGGGSQEDPSDLVATPAQPSSQEFFVRIRGMISAAKNRLNSFRYRPTLLVIPEDDYFYQDFKERDMDGSSNRKSSFRGKFSSKKGNTPTLAKKMESIHGSNLGAAMLEAKLAPPLPPPRNAKSKSKKRAPSPPGGIADCCRESPSPVSLKDLGGSLGKKKRKLATLNAAGDNYSKFDLFRLDLYEKISRMRGDGSSTENEIAVLEMDTGKKTKDDMDLASTSSCQNRGVIKEGCCSTLEYPSGHHDSKISRRQLLYKLQENEPNIGDPEVEYSQVHKTKSKRTKTIERVDEEERSSSRTGSRIVEESVVNETSTAPSSRPSTSLSNRSAHSSSSPPSTMKEILPKTAKSAHLESERDDLSECSETSDASLSGDSLNSGFREPSKSPASLKSKNYLVSSEDLSAISGSTVLTSSTAIKEVIDYEDDDDDDEEEEEDDYDDEEDDDATTQDDDSRLSTDLDVEMCSLDESEHPSLEEYLQLSSQVAKKLSERTVPAFSTESLKEKNVISQFMKEFKTTIGRLKSAEDSKPKSARTSPPGADNWTLKKEEKKAKVARKVSIFKRNPLKGRKNEELLVTDESEKNGVFYDNASVTETEDAASSRSSSSSVNSKKGKQKYKNKPPEIIPAAKVIDVGDKTIISITNANQTGVTDPRDNAKLTPLTKVNIPRVGKAVTPPLPPPKPHLDHFKIKNMASFRKTHQEHDLENGVDNTLKPNGTAKSPTRCGRTPSIESDSISIANSDMTEDSLNTPVPPGESGEENGEDLSEDENEPIDRCLAQLADSVIQPPDDTSLNRYLNQLGNVLATREESELDQCLSKLAISMNGNRATKGFNLSQHLPLCAFEHVCVDRGSDRSTPTSDRSSTTSRGSRSSQENLRKRTLTKSKHHYHHHRPVECKHANGDNLQLNTTLENNNQTTNRKVLTNGNEAPPTGHKLMEKVAQKGLLKSKHRTANTSEEEECGRASSLGSTRELETPIPETTSDPEFADSERPRKKRPLFRRSKKGLNGTCRQHIQNNKLNNKKDNASRKGGFQTRNSSTPRSSSSDVTIIQLEGDTNEHVTNVDSSNTFVTLINVDSSDCSNSAEEK